MPQQIVIAEQLRIAAVLTDECVDELIVAQGRYQIGDVYLGTVENVLPGIDAAFVNIGESEKNGFIHVTDLGPLRLKKGAAGNYRTAGTTPKSSGSGDEGAHGDERSSVDWQSGAARSLPRASTQRSGGQYLQAHRFGRRAEPVARPGCVGEAPRGGPADSYGSRWNQRRIAD